VEFSVDLPRHETGKICKRPLKQRYAAAHEARTDAAIPVHPPDR
jgi:acyl-coenzyme A synthetase/AMP-(fatty) acid ligase